MREPILLNPPFQRRTAPLSALIAGAIAPVLQARGIARAAILTEWAEIVGPAIAPYCLPLEIKWPHRHNDSQNGAPISSKAQKASQARLIIACPGAFVLDLQAATPTLLEAINRRLGWNCIGSVQISQMPLPKIIPTEPPRALDPALIQSAKARLNDIDSVELRKALAILGAEISQRAANPAKAD
jgi:hypothetical protein